MPPEQGSKAGKRDHRDDERGLNRAHREPGIAPLNPAPWR